MKRSETIYQYEVFFDPNGAGYTVTVPMLPGLVTEGRNMREARAMAKDAIRCHLEALLKDAGRFPLRVPVARRARARVTA